ncbi:MAG: decaprenylphospho-beta-D-erythro-pentofuranosid-2-ulose 2-reductase [Acidimicrobiales bacterium]
MLDAFGQPQSMVVLGGTSDIARAIVRSLAPARAKTVVLAGRDESRLAEAAAEAEAAGAAHVPTVTFDARDVDGAARVVDECFAAAGDVDLVLVAVGVLSRREDELEPARTAEVATAGFTWPAAALSAVGARMKDQGHGRIVVLSSAAGVRVRRANFVYGATKAGLDGFALGLGEALRGTGVDVQVVRPGFVRTRMTEGMPAAPMSTTAEAVAEAVVDGLASDTPVIWVPPALRWLFLVLRQLPAAVWRRLPG